VLASQPASQPIGRQAFEHATYGLKGDQVKRLKELETENTGLCQTWRCLVLLRTCFKILRDARRRGGEGCLMSP